jgi:aquaglyceroporin related protein
MSQKGEDRKANSSRAACGIIPQEHAEDASSLELEQQEETKPIFLWSRIRNNLREPLSEFFGTMILVLFGNGVTCQVFLSGEKRGNYQSVSWGWG